MKTSFRHLISLFSFVLALTFVLAGCSDETPTEMANATLAEQLSSSSGFRTEINVPDDSGKVSSVPSEYSDARMQAEAQVHATHTLLKAVSEAENWQEANQKVRSLLQSEVPDDPLYHRQQVAADMMLRKRLLDAPASSERQEAVGFYTNLLIENGNVQAPVIRRGLQTLKGYWSNERIAEAATNAARNAQKGLDEMTCEDCPSSKLAASLDAQKERAAELRNTRQAVKQLRAMSQQ